MTEKQLQPFLTETQNMRTQAISEMATCKIYRWEFYYIEWPEFKYKCNYKNSFSGLEKVK